MTSNLRPAKARELLSARGYVVSFRRDGWVECLVWSPDERWVGLGREDDDALEDALRKMCPSRLARAMLEAELAAAAPLVTPIARAAEPAAKSAGAAVESAPPPDSVEAPPTVVEVQMSAPLSATISEVRAANVEPAPAAPAPAPKVATNGVASVPQPPPSRSGATGGLARADDRAPATRRADTAVDSAPRLSPDEALGAVEEMIVTIEEYTPELAALAPEIQRHWLLIWICRARGFQEYMPESHEISRMVARVAKRLTELAKSFWPGSVRALQLQARPADLGLGRRASEELPRSWREAAAVAERTLDQQLADGQRLGLDEDGWADATSLDPPPGDPEALLASVASQLEKLVPSPGAPSDVPVDHETGERMIRLAKTLRWLRGSARDRIAWGTAMGRLRSVSHTLGTRDDRLRDLTSPRYRPPIAWALLARDAPVREPPPPLPELPDAAAGPTSMAAWIVDAFDRADTPKLAEHLRARKDVVLAIDEGSLPTGDRRLRRRLRELQRRIQNLDGDGAPPESAAASSVARDEEVATIPTPPLQLLCEKLRPHLAEKNVLFVSNREDPLLQAKLNDLLGVELVWSDCSPRRIQAQCERIGQRRYDFVLSATGFQDHSVDGALARASAAAGVPLVRVNRGRPLACVRAIVRHLGLDDAR